MSLNDKLFLGIDQGSSSTKAILCTVDGKVLWEDSLDVTTLTPHENEATQDPEELLQSVKELVKKANSFCQNKISAMGFSLQRSGVCAWDRQSGASLHPLMTWRDRRYEARAANLTDDEVNRVSAATSLPSLPDYAALKISELQKQFSGENVLVGTLDSFLVSSLSTCQSFVTEESMASRTLLYDLKEGEFTDELCAIFKVDKKRLPSMVPSLSKHCTYEGIPLVCLLGDKQASSLIDCVAPGDIGVNFGTTTAVALNAGSACPIRRGFLSSVQISRANQKHFLVEGIFNSSGAILKQLASLVGSEGLFGKLATIYESNHHLDLPVVYLPLQGSGTPHWRYDLPCVSNQAFSSWDETFIAAALENIVFGVARLVLLIREEIQILKNSSLNVSGRICSISPIFRQLSALTGSDIKVLPPSSSAKGAALGAAKFTENSEELSWESKPLESFEVSKAGHLLESRFQTWLKIEDDLTRGELDGYHKVDTTPQT